MTRARLLLSACLLALCGCGEETYPARPITIICPWSIGGGTDRVSRQVALYLEHDLGVPVNVVNATGGRGVTGHSRGLRARPDGYTVAMVTVELNMLHWQDLTEISWQDAAPLMSINEDAAALFVRTDAPWQSAAELVAAIEAEPQRLTASGTAGGAIWHLALAGWLESLGLPTGAVKWVPMSGAGPSLQELASGGVDIVCCSLPEARSLFEQGRVRCLGVMAEERVPAYPTVPTLIEQGMDWTMVGWRGLAVPRETPPERIEVLVGALERIVSGQTQVAGKTFADFMAIEGFNNSARPPDEFRQFLAENDAKFGALLQSDAFADISSRGMGPYAFPGLLFALGAVLLVALGIGRLRNAAAGEPPATRFHGVAGWRSAAAVAGAVVVYALLAERAGFLLAAGLVLLALLRILGSSLRACVLTTVLLVPAIYALFAYGLRVPLPQGPLGW